mmetsp:Transcript_46118/g.128424  ORF Transcript_46118/g.128424 Transcript_46118/m.128424 type:complete len:120 (-) Transcript_46118:1082-1441(-)
MKKTSRDLEADEKALDAKIKRKQADLERHEKRLKSLQSVRSMTLCKLPSFASVRHLQAPAPRSIVCRSTHNSEPIIPQTRVYGRVREAREGLAAAVRSVHGALSQSRLPRERARHVQQV